MPKRSLPHQHHSLVRSESAPLDLFDHSFTADFNNLSLASSPDLDPFSIPRPINVSRHAHHPPSTSLSSSPSNNSLSLPSQRKPPHPSNNSNNLNPNINNANNNVTANSIHNNKPLASRSVSSIELAEIVNASHNRNPFPPRLSPIKPLTSKPLSSPANDATTHSKSAFRDWSVFDMIQNDFPETPAPAIASLPPSTRQPSLPPNASAHRASTHVKPVAHRRSRLASTASLDLDLNRLAIGDPTEPANNTPPEPPSLNHNDIFRSDNSSVPRHRRSVSVNWTGNLESLAAEIPRSASRPNLLNNNDPTSSLFTNTSDQLLHSSSGITSQSSSAVTKSESTSPEPNTPVAAATSSHPGLSAPIPSSAANPIPTSQSHRQSVNSSFSSRPQAVTQKSFPSSNVPDSHLPRVDDLSFPTLHDYEHLYQETRESPVPNLSANVQPANHTFPQTAASVAGFPSTQTDLLGGSSHMQQLQGSTDYGNIFNGVGLFPSPFSNTNMGIGAAGTPSYSDSFRDGLAAVDNLKNMGLQMAAFLNAQQQLYAAHVAHMAALTGNTGISNPNAFAGISNPFHHIGSSGHSSHPRTPWNSSVAPHRPAPRGKHHYDQHRGGSAHLGSKKSNSMEQSHKSRNGRNRRSHRSQDEVSFVSGQKPSERVGMGSSVVGGTIQDSSHSRSALLEEFRATSNSIGRGFGSMSDLTMSGAYGNLGHVPNGREWQLSEIENNVVEFATDQHGSRFIQQKLETATQEEKDSILKQALTDAQRLMTDVFGNYVVQKLLEHGGHNAVKLIAGELEGRMLVLSLHMYGCRVVQKALEVLDSAARAALVRELNGHVLKCIRDQNGNHVIQKCVELVESESVQFIVDAVLGQAVILAGHSYGCRVVQRILEHGAAKQKAPIMSEIMSSIPDLIKDQYGNYVIQHVVEHGTVTERGVIMKLVVAEVCQLSQHKFASNVVERCLQFGSLKEQEILIEILIVGEGGGSASPLTHLVRDQFGNYVVQRVLDVALTPQRERVVSILRAQVPAIKKYSYGKHIIARLEEHQVASTAGFTTGHAVHPQSGNMGSVPRVERNVGPSVVSVGTSQGLPSSSHSYFYYD
ncbi:Armadillo-like helical domain containing protein [Gracilaria domingensis]|nr:Armadillo-like helical domain containing protein [Gracilaria domingensis]